ncbi:MAG TPA: hypothetical protein VG077_16580 [Verrucomicrobiae bacterium]|nr:hypothetical protein [Verrucomicrobiae bacterium]
MNSTIRLAGHRFSLPLVVLVIFLCAVGLMIFVPRTQAAATGPYGETHAVAGGGNCPS